MHCCALVRRKVFSSLRLQRLCVVSVSIACPDIASTRVRPGQHALFLSFLFFPFRACIFYVWPDRVRALSLAPLGTPCFAHRFCFLIYYSWPFLFFSGFPFSISISAFDVVCPNRQIVLSQSRTFGVPLSLCPFVSLSTKYLSTTQSTHRKIRKARTTRLVHHRHRENKAFVWPWPATCNKERRKATSTNTNWNPPSRGQHAPFFRLFFLQDPIFFGQGQQQQENRHSICASPVLYLPSPHFYLFTFSLSLISFLSLPWR